MGQLLIFLTAFIIQFTIAIEMNFIGPLAPFLSQHFGIKASQVAFFNLGYSAIGILVPLFGIWADKYGNKKLMSLALSFFLVGNLICSFSSTALQYAAGRIFLGLGYFSLSGTLMSYISEFVDYKKRGKAAGILRLAFGLAILSSPLYSAILSNKYNNLKSMYLPLALLTVIALLMLSRLPESRKETNVKLDTESFIKILKNPHTIKVLGSLFLLITAPTMLYNFLSINLSTEHGLSQKSIGIVYSIMAMGTILGIAIAAMMADRIGKLRFSRYCFTIMVLSIMLIAYIPSVFIITFLASAFAFGLDSGWTAYQAFSSEIFPENRSTFLGLFYTVNAFTVAIQSIVGPLLFEAGGLKLTTGFGFTASAVALFILFRISHSHA